AQEPGARPGPQCDGRRDLAIRNLAERATVLPNRAHRVRPLFGETGAVENQDAAALRNHSAQAAPHRRRIPRRERDEVLEGLVGDRLGDARQHRLHRLAVAVAEDALNVGAQRHQLRTVPKAALELLQPPNQALDARGRRLVDHRAAPYQTLATSTM